MRANTLMITAIFVVIAFCSVGRAAVPLGTVYGELFSDNQCTQQTVTPTNWTEANVAMDGSRCQTFDIGGFTYANIVKCSNDGDNQYYNEYLWQNTKTCSGPPAWSFTHVGPVGKCNAIRGTPADNPSDVFTAYSKLICGVDTVTGPNNGATAMTATTYHVGILLSILMFLLTLA